MEGDATEVSMVLLFSPGTSAKIYI